MQSNDHASPHEYENYLRRLNCSEDWRRRLRNYQLRFVQTYPNLDVWFQRPLRERVGWRNGDQQSRRLAPTEGFNDTNGWVNHVARPYVIYLGLTGRISLDWGWLFGVGILNPWVVADTIGLSLSTDVDALLTRQSSLRLSQHDNRQAMHWALPRLLLHNGLCRLDQVTFAHVEELRDAIHHAHDVPEIDSVIPERTLASAPKVWNTYAFKMGVALYHAGVVHELPRRNRFQQIPPVSQVPTIATVMERYLRERSVVDRPTSVAQTRQGLRRLSAWLAETRPDVVTLRNLTRDDLVEFITWLKVQRKQRPPHEPISPSYVRLIIHQVVSFFRHGADAEWPEMPARSPLTVRDVPKMVTRVPRWIPANELEPLLDAIRDLECSLQRCALLVARWSGARRGEIRKLEVDCLDAYPDGTPRLRLQIGKSKKERVIPLHEEAAAEVRALAARRIDQGDRPIYDADLGRSIRYLFLQNGRLAATDYLFFRGLETACRSTGLLNDEGKPTVTAHRFRHTLGTELGEKGARLQTIMKILGHRSAGMSMTYVSLSDPAVLADYASVLKPGAVLAGPQAEAIRTGDLGEEAVTWLKTNFLKTELELGRCLRLPQEGPCECDLYLTCSKFVTTPEYADRLRRRVAVEEDLIKDAEQRGREREAQRHRRIRERVIDLLTELEEPLNGSNSCG